MSKPIVPTAAPLDPSIKVGKEIQRIIQEDLALAISACDQHQGWETRRRTEAIRLTRKAFKRIRATADLIRVRIDTKQIENLRDQVRDLGRRLSPLRDQHVIEKTVDELEQATAGKKRKRNVRVLRSVLSSSDSGSAMDHRSQEQLMSEIAEEARSLQTTMGSFHMNKLRRSDVLDRLARSWDRARIRFQSRRKFMGGHDEFLHETRKRVISLHLQLSVLHRIDPKPLRKTIKKLHRVSEALGSDHDLLVVSKALAEERDRFHALTQVLHLEDYMAKNRKNFQTIAYQQGRSALKASEKILRKRLVRRWK